jgi:tetratricopeptide (TPR) repeat protein
MRLKTALLIFLVLLHASASLAFDHSGISYRDLAEYHASKGNEQAALAYYAKALAANPADVLIYQSRGFYYLSLKKPNRALEDFSQQISIRPTDPAGYLNRGMLLGSIGRDHDADEDFVKACALGSPDGCRLGKNPAGGPK